MLSQQRSLNFNVRYSVQVLQHWLQLLQQGEQLRLLAQQLQHLLAQRNSSNSSIYPATAAAVPQNGTNTHVHSLPAEVGELQVSNSLEISNEVVPLQQVQQLRQQILQQVEQLLNVESAAVAAADVVRAAEGLMADHPEGLLQQLLAQVQNLFNIPSLAGVPASMNKVGGSYNTMSWPSGCSPCSEFVFWIVASSLVLETTVSESIEPGGPELIRRSQWVCQQQKTR